ncbi:MULTISPECIES: DNA sulfur modification protein DndB [Nocardia]|uniref:DGQHR domain-containing protein n=1 Tax=Nocardia nova TaxID=37330 RepID=A0A2T2ZDL6_9NOCA|nr:MULTISPECIES: DNA sulfur modification protein DndB [Nocardia]PSR65867.1 hypothetical protein C8259_00295 [Nocardia nova]
MNDTTSQLLGAPDIDTAALASIGKTIRLQKVGILTHAGKMSKIVFSATFREIGEQLNFEQLLKRHDFDIDSSRPGNRDIAEAHWHKIAEFLQDSESERPFLGMLTIAMNPDQVTIEQITPVGEGADLVKFTIFEGAEHPVIEDGQHRNRAAVHAWRQVKDVDDPDDPRYAVRQRLAESSITIEMLLENETDVLSTIFVQMASTKPISPALVAVMDVTKIQNRLGKYVMNKSDLFRNRAGYLGTKAAKELAAQKGKEFEDLYRANAARDAAANLAGVGVKDRSPDQRERLLEEIITRRAKRDGGGESAAIEATGNEIVSIIDYAYRTLPGWREIATGRSDVKSFKSKYVHSTASGLTAIVTVLAAARACGVSTEFVIDVMAKVIPWKRDALRDAQDEDGNAAKVHEFFEGTLVVTKLDKDGMWTAGTAGARRDLYEEATRKIIRALASADARLKPLEQRDTLIAVGLESAARKPGRPRKTV